MKHLTPLTLNSRHSLLCSERMWERMGLVQSFTQTHLFADTLVSTTPSWACAHQVHHHNCPLWFFFLEGGGHPVAYGASRSGIRSQPSCGTKPQLQQQQILNPLCLAWDQTGTSAPKSLPIGFATAGPPVPSFATVAVCHGHTRSKLRLRPTPQLTAMPDP